MGKSREFSFPDAGLELLFDGASAPAFELPVPLERAYRGGFGLGRPTLVANFVASIDGAVALEGSGESGAVISGSSAADRFVMGLLRAASDAVVIGASTLRASPTHLWTPARVFAPAAEPFAALRRTLGLRPEPTLVVVTATGDLDGSLPALRAAIVATTRAGGARLRGRLPPTARVIVLEGEANPSSPHTPLALAPLVEGLRAEGFERLLTEGGPSLAGRLLTEDLLDELFLTISPKLFGRYAGDARKALVDGVDLGGKALELASARRHGSHLFLRYTRA
ncbi:MAG TPA: dihydrofolate reductase family protein [Polyangiaceae bacterium]